MRGYYHLTPSGGILPGVSVPTVVQLLGLLLLIAGCALVAVWLGLVVAGVGLLLFGVAAEVDQARRPPASVGR